MNRLFFTLFSFSIFLSTSIAQTNYSEIDSLNQIINNPKSHDTTKVLCCLELANILYLKNPDTAIVICKKAELISEKINFVKGQADIFGWLGYLLEQKGEISEAIKYDHKCLRIQKDIGNKEGVATSLNNIGYIYKNQGDISEALGYYYKSLKIREEIGNNKGVAQSLNNIAYIYSDLNDIPNALKYFNKSKETYEKAGDKIGIAISLNNIGRIYASQNKYQEALNHYKESFKISIEIGDELGKSIVFNSIGYIYEKQNKNDSALIYYLNSLEILENIGNKRGTVNSLISIGALMLKIEETRKAFEYANRAILLSKELESPNYIKQSAKLLSQIYEAQNKGMEALEMYKLYSLMHDSILSEETQRATAEKDARYKYDKQKAIDDIEYQKSLAIEKEAKARQKLISYYTIAGFILAIAFLIFVFNRLRVTRRQKRLIEKQRQDVSAKNKELNKQAEELQLLNENLNQQNEEITVQRDEIERQKEFVETIHNEISKSIDYATRLQNAVLPESKILDKYLSDHFVYFKPKDKVSGDFYWWSHVEGHTVITAADSTGHGVPGAFMSMLGSSFLREIVQKEYITHTGVILRKLRKEVVKSLKQTGESGTHKDGMDMALISINQETKLLQFSGANNPLYIITKTELKGLTDEDKSVIKLLDNLALGVKSSNFFYEIKPDKMPIGIYDKMDKFAAREIQLKEGDLLYMFSDGYADQFGGPKGKKFKYKPFKRMLLENSEKTMREQKEALSQAFENWRGDEEQVDDVVVIGLRI